MAAPIGKVKLTETAVKFLNDEFVDNITALKNVKEVYKRVLDSKTLLENKLSLASSEVPSEVETAIHDAESTRSKINNLCDRKEALHHEMLDHIRTVQPLVDDVTKLTNQIEELQKYTKYMSYVSKVEELSSQVQTALLTESMVSAVSRFQTMSGLYTQLHNSQCTNLLQFVKDTVNFWYKILKDKIASEFEDVIKNLGWPFIVTAIKAPPSQNPELRTQMDNLFIQLLHLQLPDSLSTDTQVQQTHPMLSHIPTMKPLILPLQLMVKPFRKRFRYHFYGNKQTNSLDKPEWYFAQVLGWIRDHSHFLDDRIQPLLNKNGYESVDAKTDFMRGLVALVIEKMSTDMADILYDEYLFSHLVDEAILFDKELKNGHSFPANFPGSMDVLTIPDVLGKWIVIEKKFAREKMDVMLTSTTAWQSQYSDIVDVDELKVPECGESFITLMLTITDRYKCLPSPVHKLNFLKLQLELLEDFRIRLVQVMKEVIHHPLDNTFCAILNAVYYVTEVLHEWSDLVFFVQLQYYSSRYNKGSTSDSLLSQSLQTSGSHDNADSSLSFMEFDVDDEDLSLQMEHGVFDGVIDLYDNLKKEMLKNIVNHISTDVQSRSQPYRRERNVSSNKCSQMKLLELGDEVKDLSPNAGFINPVPIYLVRRRWISLASQKDAVGQGLSTSACEMLLVLKDHMTHVENLLSKPLFTSVWQRLAEKLNRFIYDEVILQNRFNEGGAIQLQFDMTRNLFPLFGEFTNKPENYFREVKEACILLNIKIGSAILLREVLTTDSKNKDSKKLKSQSNTALHELGIFKLASHQAQTILALRTNLPEDVD